MAHYDPRKHPQWSAIRDALARELMEEGGDYKSWAIPHSPESADVVLSGLADVAVEAAFALEQIIHK